MAAKISFIVCSITEQKITALSARLHACIAQAHEIIVIRDAKSLCEGYTRGLQQATADILVFCHDDIDFFCDEALLPRLEAHLAKFDVVGVAGTSALSSPFWMASGPSTWSGLVIHHKPKGSYDITLYDADPAPIRPVQALDGVFLAMRRSVAEQVGFDATTFDGFHCYDIDFTYRCHLAGYRLGACKDLLLVHESGGNFADTWRQYGTRFLDKFPQFAGTPLNLGLRYLPCGVIAHNEKEARDACAGLLNGFIDPAQHPGEENPHETLDRDYTLWLARKSLQEIDGQVLAERMMTTWRRQPRINVLIEVNSHEAALLADSIDTLATQWYPHWHLTVLADFPPFDDELAAHPQISWIHCPNEAFADRLAHTLSHQTFDLLCLLEVGARLEGHALAYLADTFNLPSAPKLIYCDEDIAYPEQRSHSPRLKPGFNLELLRSTYYFGPILGVDRASYDAVGGLQHRGSTGFYDLSLRLVEHLPNEAIAHVPEVLLHSTPTPLRELDTEAELEILRAHLARSGIAAQVTQGFLQGTQTVRYALTGQPLVSVIIPTRDQPGYLIHCIESLCEETSYRPLELIVVDHDSRDQDALDYLARLPARAAETGIEARVLHADGPFNYARLVNQGAGAAQGALLLFLDNDTEIIQPEWLDWLVAYAQQDQVVAVGPRLSSPDGKLAVLNGPPVILGLGGLAGRAAEADTDILSPGYCGRLQVAQDVSALAGSCFMVKREVFTALQGFDEINTPVYEATLDLCLRLRQQGGRLLWTPWVDLVHRGGISRKKSESDPQLRPQLTAITLQEHDYLLSRYLHQLANDPHYHRHLSLQTAYAIEPLAVIDWDTRFHSRLRVLGNPLTSASGEYRMQAPFRALQKAGMAQCTVIHSPAHMTHRVINPLELARAAPDSLMLQQAIDDAQISQLKRYRRYLPDLFITYAVDDALGTLPKKHYLHNYQAREGRARLREGLHYCNRLIVSTQPLADYCRGMIDDIVVVPNRLEKSRWLDLTSQRRAGRKPRVGWAGAQQHLGDLELIKTVVETLSQEVEWVFMGMCPPFLKPYVAEEHPYVDFHDYPAHLASLNLDLALAPLEQHLFNEGKSNLRLLEYGVMGWPVICTDIYPYQTNSPPVCRLPNDAARWIEAIRARIHDLDACEKEGEALRAWVHQHYLLEDHLDEWLASVTPTDWPRK